MIDTEREAAAFMNSVKFSLRYGSTGPLQSFYDAAADQRRVPGQRAGSRRKSEPVA